MLTSIIWDRNFVIIINIWKTFYDELYLISVAINYEHK